MNECPVCESAATDVQMAKATMKSMHEEMERLKAKIAALESAYATDVARITKDRDGWKTIAQQQIADRTFVVEEA